MWLAMQRSPWKKHCDMKSGPLNRASTLEYAQSMLKAPPLDNSFEAEAIYTACYLQNSSFTSAIPHATSMPKAPN